MMRRTTTVEEEAKYQTLRDLEVTGTVRGPWFSYVLACIDRLFGNFKQIAVSIAGALAAKEMAVAEDGGDFVYEGWDKIPAGAEYFDLRQPDCLSSLGRAPTGKRIVFFPGKLKDEIGTEYSNLRSRFTDLGTIGLFKATTNVVVDPEDLTTTNWTKSVLTAASTTKSFNGWVFSKLTCAGAGTAVVYQNVTVTISTPSVHAVVARGSADAVGETTWVRFYDWTVPTDRGWVRIEWTDHSYTSGGGATAVRVDFYGDVAVIWFSAAGVAPGNTNGILIYPQEIEVASEYAYATAVQVENSVYPTPYTPTVRPVGYLAYTRDNGAVGSMECWVQEFHTYNDGLTHLIWSLGNPSSYPFIRFIYEGTRWRAHLYKDAANYRTTVTPIVNNNGTIWQWIHWKIAWDIPNQSIRLWKNGTEETSTADSGTVTGWTPSPILYVGNQAGSNQADALITDLLIRPTADTTITHWASYKPCYDPTEIANKWETVRIGKRNLRMHNSELVLTDDRNRLVDISPSSGLMVRDAAGTIIHDVPDAPILSDAFAMGHFIPFKFDNNLYTVESDATATFAAWVLDIQGVSGGNTNVRGLCLRFYVDCTGSSAGDCYIRAVARPANSGWSSGITDMSPQFHFKTRSAGVTWTAASGIFIIDVPVYPDLLFDYLVDGQPSGSSKTVIIQQLGVWI